MKKLLHEYSCMYSPSLRNAYRYSIVFNIKCLCDVWGETCNSWWMLFRLFSQKANMDHWDHTELELQQQQQLGSITGAILTVMWLVGTVCVSPVNCCGHFSSLYIIRAIMKIMIRYSRNHKNIYHGTIEQTESYVVLSFDAPIKIVFQDDYISLNCVVENGFEPFWYGHITI